MRLYDVVLDCSDNFATRYAINDACHFESRPDVYGSIFRFDGQVSVFGAGGPCYRCLYPEPPPLESRPTCAEGGVLGALAGIVGSWQASEVLKALLHIGEPLAGRLMLVDSLGGQRARACASSAIRSARSAENDRRFARWSFARTRTRSAPPASRRSRRATSTKRCATPCCWTCASRTKRFSARSTARSAIPASQLEARLSELDTAARYVVACRVGAKSLWAAQRLRDAGFARLSHLRGGLLAYAARHEEFAFF